MSKTWVIRGRELAPHDIEAVQRLTEKFFDQGRTCIARELAQYWQWRSRNGSLKLRAALAILLGLQERGGLKLPPPRRVHGPRHSHGAIEAAREVVTEKVDPVCAYRPFQWQLVDCAQTRRRWKEALAQYHDLGVPGMVGAQLRYLVCSRQGELIGALGWQSAVERLDCRDRLVGLEGRSELRAEFLEHAVNNVRFLILPWWRVRHLASAVLAEGLVRLQRDWPERYGAPVWLVESFIDRRRFGGASYRGANWVALGWSRGYAKRQGQFVYHGDEKEIYVYVIEPRIRQRLLRDPAQALLTREYLLAQRLPGNPPPRTKRKQMSETLQSWEPKTLGSLDLDVADLPAVRQELSEFIAEFNDTFKRIEPITLCQLYLQGLLSSTERKNIEAMAMELEGPEKVRSLQRFITNDTWDEEFMRQKHWELVAGDLGDEQGVWSIDASEVAKKGEHSVGVAPQYCGALGKTANCQSGVYVCYSSPKGHALVEGRLYLPKQWFGPEYQKRRETRCRVPKETTFQTKPEIALELLARLRKSALFPGQWVTCDASFGNNEAFLGQLPPELYYLAEISSTRKVWLKECAEHPEFTTQGCTVEHLVETAGLLSWRSRKIAEGEKGPMVAGFARVRVYVEAARTPESERTLWLRNDPNGKIKYALSNAPESTRFEELIRVSAARWPIERCFQENKSELGMDHYEHRSWPGWHRHMRLVFLAQLFLQRLRLKYKKSPGTDTPPSAGTAGMELATLPEPA